MLVFSTYLKKETMKEVKQFFSSQIKSICLLFTIVVGGFLTLSSCSPPCDEGNYLGTVEECSVTADTTSSGGSGGSTGGSSGGGGDTTAPTISSYTPSSSATNIAIGDNLTVTFNEAMNTSTINNTNITLSTGGNSVATTVTLNGNTATINPTGNFTNYATYTWTIGTGVQDAAGNALASAVTYTFTSGGGGAYNPGILTNRSRLSAGYNKTGYILDNGNVIEWGDRFTTSSSGAEPYRYFPVDNLTNARWISSFASSGTYSHSCAIKEDNTAVCWGNNRFGQLGDSSVSSGSNSSGCGRPSHSTDASTACATPEFDNSSAQGNLEMVEAGAYFTLWLDKNGTVYVNGWCDSGRLGLSCSSNQLTPKTVMTGVKDILAGPSAEGLWCAHKTDNTLWCTGENSNGGITGSGSSDVMTPVQVASDVEHFGIFATNTGTKSAIGIVKSDNTVSCTKNHHGSSMKCSDKITETNIKQISGNGYHIMVVLDNGTTRAYGNNEQGTIAHGSGGGDFSSPTTTVESSIHVDGTPMTNMDYIVGGSETLFGILDNGTLVGVGGNADKELVPQGKLSSAQCSWQGGSLTNLTTHDYKCDRWMQLPIQKGGY